MFNLFCLEYPPTYDCCIPCYFCFNVLFFNGVWDFAFVFDTFYRVWRVSILKNLFVVFGAELAEESLNMQAGISHSH